jgi:hypothetical protein
MSKRGPTRYCERQVTESFDQVSRGMLDALRKPLKLTATLKRRSLRKKASGSQRSSVQAATRILSQDAIDGVESVDRAGRSRASHSQQAMESATADVVAVGLSQGAVDRGEFGIDPGFHSSDSDENTERYA